MSIRFGSRVFDKADPRHIGTVKSIVHKNTGSFVSLQFDNGWWATVRLDDLALAPDEPVEQNECDVLRKSLASLNPAEQTNIGKVRRRLEALRRLK